MKRFWVTAAAMAALAAGPSLARAAELNPACRAAGQPVSEAAFVEIGGIRQWLTIDGQNCANPVVLIVHGGPGNPNTPFAHNLFGDWSKRFTVVQWDQRGSGKTYGASKPPEDELLTMERLTQDGVETARYVAQRLGKRKVIIMGGSWGSALAVNIAQAAPELFSAYVGTAQLVNYQLDMKTSYDLTLAKAQAAGDTEAISRLTALGPPPWTDPRAFGILRRITRKYEALATEAPPKGWFTFGPGYDTPAYEADYTAGEDYSFLNFVGPKGDGMGPKIDLRKLGTTFAMPVYMLQGEADLVTPPAVSKAYFDEIRAPKKEFVVLPRTGHDPNRIMIDAQFAALTKAQTSSDAPRR